MSIFKEAVTLQSLSSLVLQFQSSSVDTVDHTAPLVVVGPGIGGFYRLYCRETNSAKR